MTELFLALAVLFLAQSWALFGLWTLERRRRIRAEAVVEHAHLVIAEALARVADVERLLEQRAAPIFDLSRFRRLHR